MKEFCKGCRYEREWQFKNGCFGLVGCSIKFYNKAPKLGRGIAKKRRL